MTKDNPTKENISYEDAVGKLEEVVRKLEKGDLPLGESLQSFEDGIKWSRVAEQLLTEARGKVEQLIKNAGNELETREFTDGVKG